MVDTKIFQSKDSKTREPEIIIRGDFEELGHKKIEEKLDFLLEKVKEREEGVLKIEDGFYVKLKKTPTREDFGGSIMYHPSRYVSCFDITDVDSRKHPMFQELPNDALVAVEIKYSTKADLIQAFAHEYAHYQLAKYGLSLIGELKDYNLVEKIIKEKTSFKIRDIKQVREEADINYIIKYLYRKLDCYLHGYNAIKISFEIDAFKEKYCILTQMLVLLEYMKKGIVREEEGMDSLYKYCMNLYGINCEHVFALRDLASEFLDPIEVIRQLFFGLIKEETFDSLIERIKTKRERIILEYEEEISEIKSDIEEVLTGGNKEINKIKSKIEREIEI